MMNGYQFPPQNAELYTSAPLPPIPMVKDTTFSFDFDESTAFAHNAHTAGQIAKRQRSNSDEANTSRLSNVLSWLPRASPEDVEKIWLYLKASMTISPDGDPIYNDHVLPLNPRGTRSRGISQSSHVSIPRSRFSNTDMEASNAMTHDHNWMQSVGVDDVFEFSPVLEDPSVTTYSPTVFEQPTMECSSEHNLPDYMQGIHDSSSTNLDSYLSGPAPSAATHLLRQGYGSGMQNTIRDSVQSHSSFSSRNSELSSYSKHSSTTTLSSQCSHSANKAFHQRAPSAPVTSTSRKAHTRSSSASSRISLGVPSIVPCTSPGCMQTFTRDADRIRHENSIHSSQNYTCLLHTCHHECAGDCTEETHHSDYSNKRADKFKLHLEKVHHWTLKQREIPKSWLKTYERGSDGWTCGQCKTFLGTWHDDEEAIKKHAEECTEEVEASLKRLSMEDFPMDILPPMQEENGGMHRAMSRGGRNRVLTTQLLNNMLQTPN